MCLNIRTEAKLSRPVYVFQLQPGFGVQSEPKLLVNVRKTLDEQEEFFKDAVEFDFY